MKAKDPRNSCYPDSDREVLYDMSLPDPPEDLEACDDKEDPASKYCARYMSVCNQEAETTDLN